MTEIILYIKTHNKTGLKYFGKTVRDPFKYKGSGKRWLHHIKKHGYDVTSEIYGKYSSYDEALAAAREFSIQHSIDINDEWANLIIEQLEGAGLFGTFNGRYNIPMSDEHKTNVKNTYAITGHSKGSKNPNFGKIWINNCSINKTHIKTEPIPDGWLKGRLPVKGSFKCGKDNPRFNPNKH